MAFDDIPEDREMSHPCSCGGNVTKRQDGCWHCDSCAWQSGSTKTVEINTYPTIENDIEMLAKEAMRLQYDGDSVRYVWRPEFVERIAKKIDELTKEVSDEK
jgi:ribosomal protein L37AE/L43A